MDLDKKKPVCGTCGTWGGNRECLEDGSIRVGASTRGRCEKLNKFKTPQGGCDLWEEIDEKGCTKQED